MILPNRNNNINNANKDIEIGIKRLKSNIKVKKLKIHIKDLLKNDIEKNRKAHGCPICGGNNYIKHGTYKGIQRYKCKECDKTFSDATNLIWSYSKKDLNKWLKFIQFMMRKKSLRFCAEKLHINLATAFYWRHKVLNGLKIDIIPDTLKGDVHINKTILRENFKGCRNIQKTKRSNIWIIAAKGDEDSMIVKPILKDNWNWNTFNEKIYSKIEEGSYIVAYKDRYIGVKAKEHNKKVVKEVKYDDRIKYIIRNLNKWLSNFRGIATKYLEEYLSLFIISNLDKKRSYMDIIHYLSFGNRFKKIKEIGEDNIASAANV